jgi:hypothetical protein
MFAIEALCLVSLNFVKLPHLNTIQQVLIFNLNQVLNPNVDLQHNTTQHVLTESVNIKSYKNYKLELVILVGGVRNSLQMFVFLRYQSILTF